MYTQTSGSDSTLRSHSKKLIRSFFRLVASGLTALLLLGSAGVAQAQSTADSGLAVIAERTVLETLVVTAPAESAYYDIENGIPPRPPVPVHEVENDLIEVEDNMNQSIEQDLERLEEATRPPMPKAELHEVETQLLEREANLNRSIEKDLERLKEATRPPIPKVEQHEVENTIIEVGGDLETSIEKDLDRLENKKWVASWERVPLGF